MSTKYFYTIALAFFFYSHSNAQNYNLEISIKNCNDNKVIISDFQKNTILGSKNCKNGIASFVGNLEEPIFSKLEVEGNDSFLNFFLDNHNIKINTHYDSLWSAQILNSKLNEEYKTYEDLVANPIREQLVNYSIERRILNIQDSVKINIINNKIDSLQAETIKKKKKFINKNTESFLSLF